MSFLRNPHDCTIHHRNIFVGEIYTGCYDIDQLLAPVRDKVTRTPMPEAQVAPVLNMVWDYHLLDEANASQQEWQTFLDMFAVMLDHYFFQGALFGGPFDWLKIHAADIPSNELKGYFVFPNISLNMRGRILIWLRDPDTGRRRSKGKIVNILVHELIHAYLSIFFNYCPVNNDADQIDGDQGHGQVWSLLMNQIVTHMQTWHTEFDDVYTRATPDVPPWFVIGFEYLAAQLPYLRRAWDVTDLGPNDPNIRGVIPRNANWRTFHRDNFKRALLRISFSDYRQYAYWHTPYAGLFYPWLLIAGALTAVVALPLMLWYGFYTVLSLPYYLPGIVFRLGNKLFSVCLYVIAMLTVMILRVLKYGFFVAVSIPQYLTKFLTQIVRLGAKVPSAATNVPATVAAIVRQALEYGRLAATGVWLYFTEFLTQIIRFGTRVPNATTNGTANVTAAVPRASEHGRITAASIPTDLSDLARLCAKWCNSLINATVTVTTTATVTIKDGVTIGETVKTTADQALGNNNLPGVTTSIPQNLTTSVPQNLTTSVPQNSTTSVPQNFTESLARIVWPGVWIPNALIDATRTIAATVWNHSGRLAVVSVRFFWQTVRLSIIELYNVLTGATRPIVAVVVTVLNYGRSVVASVRFFWNRINQLTKLYNVLVNATRPIVAVITTVLNYSRSVAASVRFFWNRIDQLSVTELYNVLADASRTIAATVWNYSGRLVVVSVRFLWQMVRLSITEVYNVLADATKPVIAGALYFGRPVAASVRLLSIELLRFGGVLLNVFTDVLAILIDIIFWVLLYGYFIAVSVQSYLLAKMMLFLNAIKAAAVTVSQYGLFAIISAHVLLIYLITLLNQFDEELFNLFINVINSFIRVINSFIRATLSVVVAARADIKELIDWGIRRGLADVAIWILVVYLVVAIYRRS
ncbi:hypothetical protein F4777DRAFT_595849 [Nemania sp. FL0916]|nr:hypothetical protein F4777DRAFT_595849 [Nemania sp. FL0916]